MKNKNKKQNQQMHQPVLLEPVLEFLNPQSGETYLDLTAGYGGHAMVIAERVGSRGQVILVDRDADSIRILKELFKRKARVIHSDFKSAVFELDIQADMILLDLGVSSPQLESRERGFSFLFHAPLDMRMDQRQQLTAGDIVNSYSQEELADVLWRYGEEHASRRIARAIVNSRPISSTDELARVVASSLKKKRGRIHPATKTFQALRIEVNQELKQLEETLPRLPSLLEPGGRLAVISFHSLEDRIVKRFIKEQDDLRPLNKKVIQGRFNDVSNPRARSAKLRAAIKIENKNKTLRDSRTKPSGNSE